jgi:hypothetical protein
MEDRVTELFLRLLFDVAADELQALFRGGVF